MFHAELGQFAGKHLDAKDCTGGVTCMITMSDVEDEVDTGTFMVGDLGAAIGR